ncbi:hypothetical protein AAC387_Pa04g2067 [Persea americana]
MECSLKHTIGVGESPLLCPHWKDCGTCADQECDPVTCSWSLVSHLFWEDDLTLVFQELQLPVSMSVPEWKALRAGWRDHGCRGDYHQRESFSPASLSLSGDEHFSPATVSLREEKAVVFSFGWMKLLQNVH